jgi:hypothetical protein
MTDTTQKTSGEISMNESNTFCWIISGEKTPEIYGWIEDENRRVKKGTAGWYRTIDPQIALSHAKEVLR